MEKAVLLEHVQPKQKIAFSDSIFAHYGSEIPLYLTRLPAEKLGDLVPQGFAGETGIFVYQTEFEEKARILSRI